MAGDLFCWPCVCVFVLCEHMAFILVFCVPCALVSNVLTPRILLPDYWLICPTCLPSLPSLFSPFIIFLLDCLQSCASSSFMLPCVVSCLALPSLCCQSVFPYGVFFVCCCFVLYLTNKAHSPAQLSPHLIPSPQPWQYKLAKRGLSRDGHLPFSISHHRIVLPPSNDPTSKRSLFPSAGDDVRDFACNFACNFFIEVDNLDYNVADIVATCDVATMWLVAKHFRLCYHSTLLLLLCALLPIFVLFSDLFKIFTSADQHSAQTTNFFGKRGLFASHCQQFTFRRQINTAVYIQTNERKCL